MALSKRTLFLALALTRGIGGKTITRVATRNDLLGRSPDEFLRLSKETVQEEYRISHSAAESWHTSKPKKIREAEALQARLDALGVHLVTAADAHYPALVEEMNPNPPGVLFLYGNVKLLDARTFCVLSSRKSPPAALNLIESLAEQGVQSGEVLVSGHDTPEYQRSAVVPLRWGAPRILVLDTGLFSALGDELTEEPFRLARLWRYQFDPITDLALTSMIPQGEYLPAANKDRDRLIGCLSRRLDFVLLNEGGNMEKIAKMAIKANRKVRVSDLSINYREMRGLGAEIY